MSATPDFSPLMKGLAAGPANPFAIACDQTRRGVDAGRVAWSRPTLPGWSDSPAM